MPIVIKGRIRRRDALFYVASGLVLIALTLLIVATSEIYLGLNDLADQLGIYAYLCLTAGVIINLLDLFIRERRSIKEKEGELTQHMKTDD